MNLYIRADADSKVGTGHIMRCIALAQAWQDRGGKVTFISRCDNDALRERIQREGVSLLALDRACPDSSDLKRTLSILKNESADHKIWLVLDGYHFTREYQKAIRDEGIHLLVIDDMNHLPYYHADILLNQNIHAPGLKYHCDEDTTLLLGTRYVLLRREFLKYKDFKRQIPDRARNILVTLGGADPDNVTLKFIRALNLLDDPEFTVTIIIGPANPHRETLRKALAASDFRTELLINPPNMPELMAWADMAVSASGSTCWELAFMGVPIVAFIIADNQESVAEGITKEGFAVNLGWHDTVDTWTISQAIDALDHSKDRRSNMVRKGQALINGAAGTYVLERMAVLSIFIEHAKECDCELIWNWANEREVRHWAFCSDMISFEDHKRWFYSKINDPRCYLFVGYNGSYGPIGQIRFDQTSDREYEVDINIDKSVRSRGYGSELIRLGICELMKRTGVDVIHSHVKFGNRASKSAFLKAGFIHENDTVIKDTECSHLVWKQK